MKYTKEGPLSKFVCCKMKLFVYFEKYERVGVVQRFVYLEPLLMSMTEGIQFICSIKFFEEKNTIQKRNGSLN